jgi:hypothetical protein
MKNKFILPALMFIGFTFGTMVSNAQSNSTDSKATNSTEISTPSTELLASNVEPKSSVAENTSTEVKKQKATKPMKKDWDDRTLMGKILIITGGIIFGIICLLYGTVTVG